MNSAITIAILLTRKIWNGFKQRIFHSFSQIPNKAIDSIT
uniref:Uncharacterized protein n=1 Tax=Rhizophora mucronata TaxID=61149 RepID=A0A2P2R3B7_RHIMU